MTSSKASAPPDVVVMPETSASASTPEPGLRRRIMAFNDKLMLAEHVMEKGWKGARHSHPHEQLVYVISGHIKVSAGDKSFECRAGDSFVVPGGMEHEAAAVERSVVLDVFAPSREEYR
jgi:quercetin dioxygenase-like cupin family protein